MQPQTISVQHAFSKDCVICCLIFLWLPLKDHELAHTSSQCSLYSYSCMLTLIAFGVWWVCVGDAPPSSKGEPGYPPESHYHVKGTCIHVCGVFSECVGLPFSFGAGTLHRKPHPIMHKFYIPAPATSMLFPIESPTLLLLKRVP